MTNRDLATNRAEELPEEDDLDFEISFYEDVINDSPDLVNALFLLGDAYTRKGLYDKGLEMDLRLSRLMPKDPTVLYNLACDYSLLKDPDKCLEALEKALKSGYRHFKHMEKDPDLANIRNDDRYKELVLRHKKR